MTPRERSRRPQRKMAWLSNQILLVLVCVLSVVLVALLFVSGNINNAGPSDAGLGSEGTVDTGTTQDVEDTTAPPETSLPPETSAPPETTAPAPTLPVTPEGGNYINVGSGYIAEVIQNNVETFDGKTSDDYSHPTNNYLPKGTVDYCDRDVVYGSGKLTYVLMRSGHRIYEKKKIYPPVQNVPEVQTYAGTLPDHNEIGVASMQTTGHHTVLTLNTLWKAPFYFDIAPQKYANPDGGRDRNYAVTSVTAKYVDITFCYTTVFTGNVTIPAGNPLFKSAEIIQNEADYTLRLHLRKTGGFYGWHAYYNEQDQLCFQFLNPTKVTAANNRYGADLTGAVILLDVGHGGEDGGAEDSEKKWDESALNMMLAKSLKSELESIGATVILNRTEDVNLHINNRQENLTQTSPDLCIAIHQNSYSDESIGGFDTMYYTPYSKVIAERIAVRTKDAAIYTKSRFQWSVNYFMCRQTVCPVVLTENGYISNPEDLAGMIDPAVILTKAQAITQGTVDYFLSIN